MNLNELNIYDIGNKIGLVGAVFGVDPKLRLEHRKKESI